MTAGRKFSSQKLQVPTALAKFSYEKAGLLLCALSALHMLASLVVPVYATEPAVTGMSLTNHPGSGDVSLCRTPSPPPAPPLSPFPFNPTPVAAIYCCSLPVVGCAVVVRDLLYLQDLSCCLCSGRTLETEKRHLCGLGKQDANNPSGTPQRRSRAELADLQESDRILLQ